MLRILESQFIGHLPDGFIRVEKPLLGRVDHLQLDILLGRFPGLLFHQIAEIIGRQAYFACKIAYRRQPFLRSGALGKVIVEQPLETCQDIEIHVPARDELALVKTHTIVEQQFYIGRNKPFGMLVDGVEQFHADFFQAVEDNHTFFLRQVQGFVGLIGKKRIFLNLLPQRRTADKIGMKQQPDRFLGNTLHVGIPHRLPRSDTDDRLVVKIITRLAVVDPASRRLLEEYRIEPHRHPIVSLTLGRIERNDADLRVAGLEPEEFVILVDSVDFQDFFHVFFFTFLQR